MPCKNQQDDIAEDNALWTASLTHAFLVLLEEHVRKNNGQGPTHKDFKVMAKKLLGTYYKRYFVGQLKLKYFRMEGNYNVFKKLLNHTGLDVILLLACPLVHKMFG